MAIDPPAGSRIGGGKSRKRNEDERAEACSKLHDWLRRGLNADEIETWSGWS